MSLKKTFNARVIYQYHSNPAVLGLYSDDLGYSEIALRDLKLSPAEIDALHTAEEVAGTYEAVADRVYAPALDNPCQWDFKPMTWKPVSLKPVK